jgi:hypothetical protein
VVRIANYDALKKKQQVLIRKALDGSVFVGGIALPAITQLTQTIGAATAGKVTGTAAAVNIATGGNLVLSVNNAAPITVPLLAADAPASVVTKINTALGGTPAALNATKLEITSPTTGQFSKVQVVSGTGTILANLSLSAGQTGAGSQAGVDLAPLPVGYEDAGWLSNDGAQFSRDVSQSEVTSWGSVSPTRTDIISDTTTMAFTAHETKMLTIGLATGADLSAIVPTAVTGEISIAKPSRPKSRYYRVLALAVDQGDAGEIYVARFLPRAKVTSFAEQSFAGGDDPITWGVTFTGETDDTLGYSERWIFGGQGWASLLDEMGFPIV